MLYILLIKWLKIFQALYNSICTKSKFPNKAWLFGITDYVLSNPSSKVVQGKKLHSLTQVFLYKVFYYLLRGEIV